MVVGGFYNPSGKCGVRILICYECFEWRIGCMSFFAFLSWVLHRKRCYSWVRVTVRVRVRVRVRVWVRVRDNVMQKCNLHQ